MNIDINIPTYGKLYLVSTIILSILVLIRSVDPYNITYVFKLTVFELSLWRPFTAAIYLSRFGLLLPFHLIFAAVAFSESNKTYGNSKKADFTWLFLLSTIMLSIFSTFSNLYFFGNSFIMILLMMQAVQHSSGHFSVGSFKIPSIYLPLLYTATMVILGSSFKNYMAGFIFGLLLGVVKSPSYIQKNGDMLPTPSFIKTFFDISEGNYEQPRVNVHQPASNPRNEGNNRPSENSLFSGRAYRIG